MNRFFSGSLITFISAVLAAMHATDAVRAGQISLADFSPAAVVQDFQILGNASGYHAAPLLIGGDMYTADDGILVSGSKLGPTIQRSGVAIGNEPEVSTASVRFIDILFGNPALRAGAYVGFQFAWSSQVNFFNAVNDPLGTILISGNGGDSRFAAWQADSGKIGRIRVINMNSAENRIIIDDLIQEVPEPGSLLGFAMGALTIVGYWRRRRFLGKS